MKMNRIPIVNALPEDWRSRDYDILFATIGYEERARYISGLVSGQIVDRVALGFSDRHDHEFEANKTWFEANGFNTTVVHEDGFRLNVSSVIQIAVQRSKGRKLRILVDISSLSRLRLAMLIDVLARESIGLSAEVHFVYALAEYTAPVISLAPNSHVGPVLHSNFTGWWEEPDRAISVVVGLGYEPDKALGAVEYLEASEVWTFTPLSEISEYSLALQVSNESLLEGVDRKFQLTYRVHEPLECFIMLESVVYGIMQTKNPVLLPFGPKIFALCCLLVACIHHDGTAVWRVSAQGAEEPINRLASGHVYGLAVEFRDRSQ
jgi:hypothetical protein